MICMLNIWMSMIMCFTINSAFIYLPVWCHIRSLTCTSVAGTSLHFIHEHDMYTHSTVWSCPSWVRSGSRQPYTMHIPSLRDTTILAMSNMLTANIDSGLTHAIGETAPHVLIIIAYLGRDIYLGWTILHFTRTQFCFWNYCAILHCM